MLGSELYRDVKNGHTSVKVMLIYLCISHSVYFRLVRTSECFRMFWSSDLAASMNKLDELLKNDSVTLADLLEDDYTLQEIRNRNHQLIKLCV